MAEKKEKVQFSGTEESALGNSLVAKWLGLCALTARVWGSIPGWGTKKKKVLFIAGKDCFCLFEENRHITF